MAKPPLSRPRDEDASTGPVPSERPSTKVLLTPESMEPVLEHTSRTANKIREELGIAPRRYDLVAVDAYDRVLASEVLENIRVAVLQALARSVRHSALSFRVLEASSKRVLCWAAHGKLYVPDHVGEATADEVVRSERR